MRIAGYVSRAALSRYSRVRMAAKRRALDETAARQRAADEKRKEEAEERRQQVASDATNQTGTACACTVRQNTCRNHGSRHRSTASTHPVPDYIPVWVADHRCSWAIPTCGWKPNGARSTKPRRSARVTYLCSVRVTHTENTIWRRARREPAISSTPKARGLIFPHPRQRRVTPSLFKANRARPGNQTTWSGGTLPAVAFGARQEHAAALRQTAYSGHPGGSLLASKPG